MCAYIWVIGYYLEILYRTQHKIRTSGGPTRKPFDTFGTVLFSIFWHARLVWRAHRLRSPGHARRRRSGAHFYQTEGVQPLGRGNARRVIRPHGGARALQNARRAQCPCHPQRDSRDGARVLGQYYLHKFIMEQHDDDVLLLELRPAQARVERPRAGMNVVAARTWKRDSVPRRLGRRDRRPRRPCSRGSGRR